jgi:hypothetical protein
MWENKTIIDSSGYVIDLSVLLKDGKPYDFLLEEGQQLVKCPTVTYVKPKWNGSDWVETATQEEIDDFKQSKPWEE